MNHLRCLGVWLTTTALAGTLAVLDLAALRGLAPDRSFADLLTRLCGLVLLGCLGWGWLGATAVVVTALRRPSAPARVRWVPLGWRRLVLGACGVALTAGVAAPAMATPGPVRIDPPAAAAGSGAGTDTTAADGEATAHEAALATPTAAARVAPPIVVSAGDSLWRLAAERLDPTASDASIDVTWHRLYDANRAVIGADPDHIEPGQRLTPPRGW
jgi:hypothetical protein